MKIIWNEVTWYSKLIAVILFLATFFVAFYLGGENQKIKNLNLSEINTIKKEEGSNLNKTKDGKYCFYRKQIATINEPYSSEESIVLNILNNKVSGVKTGIQNGPDLNNGYRGTLEGTINNNEIELTFAYEVEGSKGKEVEIYTFEGEDLIKLRYVLIDNFDGKLVPDRSSEPKQLIYSKSNCEIENQKVDKKQEILNSNFELAS
jgi:hypothetical protein